jgi:hypothetical protein
MRSLHTVTERHLKIDGSLLHNAFLLIIGGQGKLMQNGQTS